MLLNSEGQILKKKVICGHRINKYLSCDVRLRRHSCEGEWLGAICLAASLVSPSIHQDTNLRDLSARTNGFSIKINVLDDCAWSLAACAGREN